MISASRTASHWHKNIARGWKRPLCKAPDAMNSGPGDACHTMYNPLLRIVMRIIIISL